MTVFGHVAQTWVLNRLTVFRIQYTGFFPVLWRKNDYHWLEAFIALEIGRCHFLSFGPINVATNLFQNNRNLITSFIVSILHGVHLPNARVRSMHSRYSVDRRGLEHRSSSIHSSATFVFGLPANVWMVFQKFRYINFIYHLRKGKYVVIMVYN
jgi:hypothetical protein